MMRALALSLVLWVGLGLGSSTLGCGGATEAVEPWPADLARPKDAAEATQLRERGVRWTNRQIRQFYLEEIATIAGNNERWKADGLEPPERARRAFTIRHEARLTSRAMMSDRDQVADLQARDQEKYGNPDGPTFESLVTKARAEGLDDDASYESIVTSAQRTDASVNRSLGL